MLASVLVDGDGRFQIPMMVEVSLPEQVILVDVYESVTERVRVREKDMSVGCWCQSGCGERID